MIKEAPRFSKTITCPNCGKDYEPCDIFMPDKFLGKRYNVLNSSGGVEEVITFEEQDLDEVYTCVDCNCTFKTTAKIEYKTKSIDFEDILKKDNLKIGIKK